MPASAEHTYQHYRYCYDNGHDRWVSLAGRCFDFYSGEQWTAADRARLINAGRPALTMNVIEPLVRALAGMQTAMRNDVRYLPAGDADMSAAKVHDAIWLFTQNQNDFDSLESEVYKKGLIMDRAYFDVRMNFDNSVQGDIEITSPRSQDVILDPSVDTYSPKKWPRVMQRRFLSMNDIKETYGDSVAKELYGRPVPGWMDIEDVFLAQQMGQLPHYRYGVPMDDAAIRGHLVIEHQYMQTTLKECFVDVATGDFKEIPESWDNERIQELLTSVPGITTMRRKIRNVRWEVVCDDILLHAEDSPYDQFTIIPFFPSFVDGYSSGIVKHLLDAQELYNKVTSQELHIINTTANSGWKVKEGSLRNMEIEELEEVGSRSGFVAVLDDIAAMEKITPNQVPQGHDRISGKADAIMRNIAGVSNQGRGFAREDVAGEAILANQSAQEVNAAEWMNNLHRTKRMVAERVQSLAQAFYTQHRVVQINTGSLFRPEVQQIELNAQDEEGRVINDVTVGKFTTTMVPAPSRKSMTEADFKLLMKMRELGIGIRDDLLIELSPATNKAKIIETLVGDSNEREAAAAAAEQARAEAEQQKSVAAARKEEAAAVLNQARAEKFAVEAQTDPDAAYVEVEQERLGIDRERLQLEFQHKREELLQKDRHKEQDVALQLASIDRQAEATIEASKQKPPANPGGRGDKKPTSNRSSK